MLGDAFNSRNFFFFSFFGRLTLTFSRTLCTKFGVHSLSILVLSNFYLRVAHIASNNKKLKRFDTNCTHNPRGKNRIRFGADRTKSVAGDTRSKWSACTRSRPYHTTTGEKTIAITANRKNAKYFLVESVLGVRVLAHVLVWSAFWGINFIVLVIYIYCFVIFPKSVLDCVKPHIVLRQ